jgi:hypothetical protein
VEQHPVTRATEALGRRIIELEAENRALRTQVEAATALTLTLRRLSPYFDWWAPKDSARLREELNALCATLPGTDAP